MNALSVVILIFSIAAAVDYVIGNKLGIGKEYEKGFMLLGTMALSMIGMISIAPLLGKWLSPALAFLSETLGIDPSIIPASLFANDMGGAPLSVEVARDSAVGLFNGLVVSSMMGCTISFTIQFALGLVKKEDRRFMIFGLLSGIGTIPVGCFVGGLVCKLPILTLLVDLLPLVVFSGIITLGLIFFSDACVKIFNVFGVIDLSQNPALDTISWLWVIPVITFITSFIGMKISRKFQPQPIGQTEEHFFEELYVVDDNYIYGKCLECGIESLIYEDYWRDPLTRQRVRASIPPFVGQDYIPQHI